MDIVALRQKARTRAQAGIERVWRDYVAWLTDTFPRIAANLAAPDPMVEQYLAELQQLLGVPIPAELATLYRLTGGEPKRYGDDADENLGRGVLFGSELMTLREIVETARTPGNWRADGLDEDYEDPDAPVILLEPTKLRQGHRHRLWLDILDNAGGNYVSLDLAPGADGTVGQLVNRGRNQHSRFVLADSIEEFVALLHELGVARSVHVIEAIDEDDKSALFFGPTEISLGDQLRLWYFPSRS
jgi:cell wall assembly regulator SMI1